MDIKIVFHPSGDWEGLYINGELEEEGHSIQNRELVEAINRCMEDTTTYFDYSNRDLGSEKGFDGNFSFPLKYEDINNDKERI